MRKVVWLSAFLLLLGAVGAAHNGVFHQGVVPEPGSVGPQDGLLWQLDILFDGFRADKGEVIFERASEAATSFEDNRSEDGEDALDELNGVAAEATSNDTEGLDKAEAVLAAVEDVVPNEAQQGLSTALESIADAKNRAPETPADGDGGDGGDSGVNGDRPY